MKKLILFLFLIPFVLFGQSVKKNLEFTATDNTTITLNLAQYNEYIMIKGTPTLSAGNYTITKTGSPVNGMVVVIYWNCNITYSGARVAVVFGTTLNPVQAANKGIIYCLYNNSAWNVLYVPNLSGAVVDSSYFNANNFGNGIKKESGITLRVDTTTSLGFKGNAPTKTLHLKYDDTTLTAYGANKLLRVKASGIDSTRIKAAHVTLSKFQTIPRGSILAGGDGQNTLRNAKTNNYILVGNGTDVVSQAITGDVTLSSGVTAITSGAVVVADINSASNLLKEVVTATVSFDTNCLTTTDSIKVFFPYACRITKIYISVTEQISALSNGTISFTSYDAGGGGADMGHPSITASSKVGTLFTVTPSSDNNVSAGNYVSIFLTKAHKGGDLLISFFVTRL
jgi:hypothetical protein